MKILILLITLCIGGSLWAKQDDLTIKFVIDHLDVSSFPSSLGPRISKGQQYLTFKDFYFSPNKLTENAAILENSDHTWQFNIQVLEYTDSNVVICIEDRALNAGTYHTQKVISLVSQNNFLIADKKDMYRKVCPEFPMK